jgi:transposase
MPAAKKHPNELKARSIRLVFDLLQEEVELSVTAACRRIGDQLGINHDTLRGWVKQAQVDQRLRPGVTSQEQGRIRQLEKENAELRRANAILRTASAFFAAELDRPTPR